MGRCFRGGGADRLSGGVHPAAIERAAPGDTVRVARGLYQENLRIGKPLLLKGVERPTLSGGLKGDTIRVNATDVSIEGLIITDSGGDLGEIIPAFRYLT